MSGQLPTGSPLSSTSKLVTQFGAASATIQRALAVLKDEGLLGSRMGKSVYVRDRPQVVVEATTYIPLAPGRYSYQILEVAEVQTPADVAEALDLSAGEPAVLPRRLLLHAGEPVELSWSYYPTDLARGTDLGKHAKIAGGAPRVLAEIGHRQHYLVDRVSTRMATTEEIEALDLPSEVPVIRQFRVIYSTQDRAVEASVLVKGGNLYELQYRQGI